ncbi:MAG: MarR family transcriptional regulator [Trueperaceae bacterium]|nr:MAG: MarR family transcriptional regulator [Trueperaceae bacterium]
MATKHHGTPRERLALDTYIKLSRATAAVDARINRPLAEASLTTSQFGVLEAVWHLGPLTHGEIGRKLLKSSGNVTVVIDNLARRGLVQRESDAGDRRISRVALTATGTALLEAVFPAHVARVVDAFDSLDADELATLSTLLRRLGRAAAAAGNQPEPDRATGAHALTAVQTAVQEDTR